MTYVDNLPPALDSISQIQATMASLAAGPSSTSFDGVLQQVSGITGLASPGGPSGASSGGGADLSGGGADLSGGGADLSGGGADLSGSYGWPMEEGRILPGATPSPDQVLARATAPATRGASYVNVTSEEVNATGPEALESSGLASSGSSWGALGSGATGAGGLASGATGAGGVASGATGAGGVAPGATGAGGVASGATGAGGVASGATATGPGTPSDIGQQAVLDAQNFLGVPYLWGGTNPAQGVDCSGLVQDVYGELGIDLPRTSQEQALVGQAVPSLAEAEPGDLVFFPGSDGTATAPGHVGIYIGNGEMIDAPYTGTVVQIDPVGDPVAIRRVTGLASSVPVGASGPTVTDQAGLAGTTSGAPESPSPTAGSIDAPAGTTSATGTASASAGSSDAPTGTASAYQAYFAAAGTTYGVPEQLLSAVADTESSYQPDVVSSAGAEGLMQLMPATASSLGINPFDPAQAVDGAARLLAAYHNQFGSWSLALAAYNAGPGAVDQYSGVPPYAQTQAYVQAVLSRAGMEDQ